MMRRAEITFGITEEFIMVELVLNVMLIAISCHAERSSEWVQPFGWTNRRVETKHGSGNVLPVFFYLFLSFFSFVHFLKDQKTNQKNLCQLQTCLLAGRIARSKEYTIISVRISNRDASALDMLMLQNSGKHILRAQTYAADDETVRIVRFSGWSICASKKSTNIVVVLR